MPLQHQCRLAVLIVAFGIIFLVRRERFVAVRRRTGWTLENFSVGVTQSNGDVSDSLLPKFDGVDARDCAYHSGFSVRDMANSADIERGLATHDLRGV